MKIESTMLAMCFAVFAAISGFADGQNTSPMVGGAAAIKDAAVTTASPSPVWLFSETDAQKKSRMDWWMQSRFGMFIHFGLYSLPGRHEWVKSLEQMDNAAYEKYFNLFDPDRLDVREWVRQAKRAGMKYMVLTTKHHEGFCLFDSKLTDYKITNTEYGKDLVREYVDACRAAGMRIGFYYSLPDWHHEAFPIDHYHPQRPVSWGPWDERSQQVPESEWDKVNVGRDMAKYREYFYGQVTELLTNYGKIDLLWFDFTMPEKFTKHPEDWQSEKLIALVRKLQPQIIINDRLGIGWRGCPLSGEASIKRLDLEGCSNHEAGSADVGICLCRAGGPTVMC